MGIPEQQRKCTREKPRIKSLPELKVMSPKSSYCCINGHRAMKEKTQPKDRGQI
jgi:hypothetical protein